MSKLSAGNILKPAASLLIICVVITFALAVTNNITSKKIEEFGSLYNGQIDQVKWFQDENITEEQYSEVNAGMRKYQEELNILKWLQIYSFTQKNSNKLQN